MNQIDMIEIGKLYKIIDDDYHHFIIDNGFCLIVNIIKDKREHDWDIIKYISKSGIHSSYRYIIEALVKL
jgi:hypothetical protein